MQPQVLAKANNSFSNLSLHMRSQNAIERNKPLIVVGTPGRLSEFVRTGLLRVHSTPLLVLDEVRACFYTY